MARQASRNDEHGVDPHDIAGAGETRREPFGRYRNAAQPIFIERPGRRFSSRPLLHLDERDRPAAASDEVNLTAGHSHPSGQDAPAFEAKPPGGQSLCSAPSCFGSLAI
jgi:hypothetical protein